jgi:hypothetical protein
MRHRTFVIAAAICCATWAQAPRQLNVYNHSGTIDSTAFNLFDSMTIGNMTNLLIHLKTGSVTQVPLVQIDTLRFPFVGGALAQVIAPDGGGTYHVGDSLVIQWHINPTPMTAAKKVAVFISLDAEAPDVGCDSCWMQIDLKGGATGNEPQVLNADPRYNTDRIATCKWKITDPISTVSPLAVPRSPVSVRCRIKVGDYQRFNYPEYLDVSDGTFTILP